MWWVVEEEEEVVCCVKAFLSSCDCTVVLCTVSGGGESGRGEPAWPVMRLLAKQQQD